MTSLSDGLFQIELLMESGGSVLWLILFASVLMWSLIIERYLFVVFEHPKQVKRLINEWQQRKDRNSWFAHQIRQGMITESRISLHRRCEQTRCSQ